MSLTTPSVQVGFKCYPRQVACSAERSVVMAVWRFQKLMMEWDNRSFILFCCGWPDLYDHHCFCFVLFFDTIYLVGYVGNKIRNIASQIIHFYFPRATVLFFFGLYTLSTLYLATSRPFCTSRGHCLPALELNTVRYRFNRSAFGAGAETHHTANNTVSFHQPQPPWLCTHSNSHPALHYHELHLPTPVSRIRQ